jgi:hypothetical protein
MYNPQDEFIRAAFRVCESEKLSNYVVEELMSFREISYRPDYKLAVARLQKSLTGLSGSPKIISELTAWLNYVLELRAYNEYNAYVPAGSYQETSQNISITLNAQCQNNLGDWVESSPLTYKPEVAMECTDLSNNNGNLQINTKTGVIIPPVKQSV